MCLCGCISRDQHDSIIFHTHFSTHTQVECIHNCPTTKMWLYHVYIITVIMVWLFFSCITVYPCCRVVKLTSPLINYFLIVGSYMMFFSIYIRVLPYTGESVNTYRCNVSLRNSYVRYCYPTDSTMDEHDCILLWIRHHPYKDGKSLQDISQSYHQKESNCEYHTIQ